MPPSLQLISPTQKVVRYVGLGLAGFATLLLLKYSSTNSTTPSSQSWTSCLSSNAEKRPLDTQNSTLGFEKILAINLPERTDHRDGLVLASAVSGLNITFVVGVHGDKVLDKTLPAKHSSDIPVAVKGSWRAHINAIRHVVSQDWGSALIIEDDVDWDIRLKTQLNDFSVASRYLSSASAQGSTRTLVDIAGISKPGSSSPYGQNWDVLWLGHCGMDLPSNPDANIILHQSDETVAPIEHQQSWDIHASSPLARYPPYTRVITEHRQGTCSLAYAISQAGARKLLLDLGLERLDMAFDLMLREWCQDTSHDRRVCIGVLPQLFDHHRRVGANEIDSDISLSNGEYRKKAYTPNIRWSVRMNMRKLIAGETDYDDQWPDL